MSKVIRGVVCLSVILLLPLVILAQDQSWQVVKSTHFNIFYKHSPENELNAIVEKAEECYDSIAENFGFNRFNFWTWDNRAKIYLFDNQEEYLKSTQGYGWSGAQVRIDAKLIQSYVGSPGFLRNALPHELAHIIFIEMVGYNNPAVPLWLHEGVASFQEKDIKVIKADLAERINSGDYLDFKALNSFEIREADNAKVRLFYIESYSLVKYLVLEYGKEAFVNFCRNLRDSRNLMAALSKTYAIKNLQDFEESWKKFILK